MYKYKLANSFIKRKNEFLWSKNSYFFLLLAMGATWMGLLVQVSWQFQSRGPCLCRWLTMWVWEELVRNNLFFKKCIFKTQDVTVVQIGFDPFLSSALSTTAFQVFGTRGVHYIADLQMILYKYSWESSKHMVI